MDLLRYKKYLPFFQFAVKFGKFKVNCAIPIMQKGIFHPI